MTLNVRWTIGLAIVAVFGVLFLWHIAESRGAALARLQAVTDSLHRAAVQRDSADAAHRARDTADSTKAAQSVALAHASTVRATVRASAAEAALAAIPDTMVPKRQALAALALKDAALDTARAETDSLHREVNWWIGEVAYWRDTSLSDMRKQRDTALTKLTVALKKANAHWHFPCASAPGAIDTKGLSLGLAVGICYTP